MRTTARLAAAMVSIAALSTHGHLHAQESARARPRTRARLAAPYSRAARAFAVVVDENLLDAPRGLALVASDLFVATASGDVARAGVTRVADVGGLDGRLPIAASRRARVAGDIAGASQLAFDEASGELVICCRDPAAAALVRLASLEPGAASCVVLARGEEPPVPDCTAPPAFSALRSAYDVLVLPETLPCGGDAGDLVLSNAAKYERFSRFGFLAQVAPSRCGECIVRPRYRSLDRPRGIAWGDFGGKAPRGIYFAVRDGNPLEPRWLIRRSTPERIGERCSWDTRLAHHTSFPAPKKGEEAIEPDDLAFDPFAPALFVTGDDVLWRIGPEKDALPEVFATDLATPRGLALLPSGILLVAEEASDTITAIDGWRYRFIRGDVDANLRVDAKDAERLARWLEKSTADDAPGCWDAADANDDGVIDLQDVARIAAVAMDATGQTKLPAPYPRAGSDRTADLLGCGVYHERHAVSR